MAFEFWILNRDASYPAARAASLADLRATVRSWYPRTVRLTQVTDDFGDVSFLLNGETFGHVREVAA